MRPTRRAAVQLALGGLGAAAGVSRLRESPTCAVHDGGLRNNPGPRAAHWQCGCELPRVPRGRALGQRSPVECVRVAREAVR